VPTTSPKPNSAMPPKPVKILTSPNLSQHEKMGRYGDMPKISNMEKHMWLGLELGTWEVLRVGALAVAALVAVVAFLSTTATMKIAKLESAARAEALERYKAEADARIAEATARAEEARHALAKFKAPRFIDSHAGAPFAMALERYRGMRIDIIVNLLSPSPDASAISNNLYMAFAAGGWLPKDFLVLLAGGDVGATGLSVRYKYTDAEKLRGIAADIERALQAEGLETGTTKTAFDGDGPDGVVFGHNKWNAADVAPIRIVIHRKP
jgi:hypothetical protein